MRTVANICWLGSVELLRFLLDFVLLPLLGNAFTLAAVSLAGLLAGGLQRCDRHCRESVEWPWSIALAPVNLDLRIVLMTTRFTTIIGIVNDVTLLAIILAGAAIVRCSGIMDHLLVTVPTLVEIAVSTVCANGDRAGNRATCHIQRDTDACRHSDHRGPFVRGRHADLSVVFDGDWDLPRDACALYVSARTALHIDEHLSGGNTRRESMPPWLATVMEVSPSAYLVSLCLGYSSSWRRHRRGLAAKARTRLAECSSGTPCCDIALSRRGLSNDSGVK
jgi:hypothetical protein